jgi:carboxyl-terminal processing protease
VKDSDGDREILEDKKKGEDWDGPMIVLVDRFSASASEIFAGALQDYHRATILGQRTFGKGTVQNLVPLDRWSPRPVNGQLTVTIGKFYRVTGESTQHRGVEPDVPLPSQIDMEEFGESALEGALPWDRIPGVPFHSEAKSSQPNIAALAVEEKTRADKDPDYRWLVADLAAAETVRKQTSLSLNLEQRKQERERMEKDRLTRENARRAAQNLPALKTAEELADAKFPDTVLDQAAEVMTDMVTGVRPLRPSPTRTVRTEAKPGH